MSGMRWRQMQITDFGSHKNLLRDAMAHLFAHSAEKKQVQEGDLYQ